MTRWFDRISVPLSAIRHNDLPAYVRAGYGGTEIGAWPFSKFIASHLHGDKALAKREWIEWLESEFARYGSVPKREGGMYGGSVHREAAMAAGITGGIHDGGGESLSPRDIRHGAEALVDRRLAMVDSIAESGYLETKGDRIHGVRAGNTVILKGGHHRAATLWALGYTELPAVYVTSRRVWSVLGWWRATRKALNLRRMLSTASGSNRRTGTRRSI